MLTSLIVMRNMYLMKFLSTLTSVAYEESIRGLRHGNDLKVKDCDVNPFRE
jgi:hypothetical protein